MKFKPAYLAVFVCFVLLPLGSWFYIRQGVKFRTNALEELKQKLHLDSTFNLPNLGYPDLQNNVYIFVQSDKLSDPTLFTKLVRTIYEQNNGSPIVHVVELYHQSSSFDTTGIGYIETSGFLKKIPSHPLDSVFRKYLKNQESNAVILDKEANVRKEYDINQSLEQKRIIQHSAVLIPAYKKEKTELKRQKSF